MKQLLIHLVIINLIFTACGQQKKSTTQEEIIKPKVQIPLSMKYKHITAANFVEEATKLVKHFPKEPKYFIRPTQGNCLYEVLVNDKFVVKEYGIEQYATPIDIGTMILKSGTQTVTVRLYPLGDAIVDAYGEGETVTTLLPKTQMRISVVKYDAFNIKNDLDDEKEVVTHNAPTDKEGKFKGAGLPYYEYSFTFDAEVPYNLEGWSKGQDLTELDQDELKAQVVKYYKGIQKIYENKDQDALARLIFGNYMRIFQAKYWTKQDIEEAWLEALEELDFDIIEFGNQGEYKDYDLQLYGNKKMVALKHPSREPVDHRLRGQSGFWFKYIKGDRVKGRYNWYYLYLPEGEPLENLRVID